jgi:hypothetical protein
MTLQHLDAEPISVPDLRDIIAAPRRAAAVIQRVADEFTDALQRAFGPITERLRTEANAPAANRRGDRQLRLLTPANRSLIAAAAIRGWCFSHGDGPAIVAWHRLLGTTAVVVRRG